MDASKIIRFALKHLMVKPVRFTASTVASWLTHIKSDQIIYEQYSKFVRECYRNPNRVAWVPFVYPVEILYSMNLLPFTTEIFGSNYARAPGLIPDAFERAFQIGLSADSCSFHHASVGIFSQNILPKAKIILGGTPTGCEDQYHSLRILSKMFKTKYYAIDIPRNYSGEKEKLKYFKDELHGLIEFCEKETELKFEKEKLKKINSRYREVYQKYEKIIQLKAEVPAKLYEGHYTAISSILADYVGDLELVEKYFDKAIKDFNYLKFPTMDDSSKRIAWIGHPIVPLRKLQYFLAERNAFIGYQEFMESTVPPVTSKREDPIEEVAEKYLSAYSNVPIEKRLDIIRKRLNKHRYDGIVYMTTWGCHQLNSAASYIIENLKEDYPVVLIDSDSCNIKNVGEEQVKMRLEALLELIDQRN
ncbi:MAG: 2-hydroxyacyl-CoA dehydratase [Candidatus Heimdallarchaeaceae archaeon]